MKNSIKLLLLSALTFSVLVAHSQENDDMYFSKKDRKKLKPVEEITNTAEPVQTSSASGSSFLTRQNQYYNNYDPNLDTLVNGVSQESIDKYKRSNIDQYEGDYYDESADVYYESDGVVDNANYSDPDGYYDNERIVVNNYYQRDPFANRRFNAGWNVGYGWNSWGGSGLYISYGRGWNRWNRWNRYDPFFDPFYAWGNPWNSWGWGNSWASWGGYGRGFYDPFWCPPYGVGFYRNSWAAGYYNGYNRGYYGTIRDGRVAGRTVQRGARNSRGGTVSGSGKSRQLRNVSVAQTRDSRNFRDTQSRYLDRSRRSTQATGRSGSNVSVRSRNRSIADGINRSNASRVSNSRSTRQGTISSGSRSSSGRSTGVVRPSSNSRSSSGSYRSSGSSRSSRSSSGYRPSSSSSRSSSGSFRSSGSSSRSSGAIRSSGSSRSSSSRSSGSVRSSSSRSSSGSRSSSSSRGSSSRSSSSRSRGN